MSVISIDFLKNNRWYVVCLAAVFVLSLLPAIVHTSTGIGWSSVIPNYYEDVYYGARIKEIKDGYPLVGNPYFFEHRTDIAPAFFLPDMVAAVPHLLGATLSQTLAINFSAWSIIFAILVYALFRRLNMSEIWCALGVIFVYTQVYYWILRPVSMQLVHPVFMLLLLGAFYWWSNPSKRSAILFFAAAAALTVYDYQYLAQIAAFFLASCGLPLIYVRDWIRFKYFFVVGVITGVLALPAILFSFSQMSNPNYWETMGRIGLVKTHLPTGEAGLITLEIVALSALIILIYRWVVVRSDRAIAQHFFTPFLLLGVGITLAGMSNVFTGLELETASHVARFVILWMAIGSVAIAHVVWSTRGELRGLSIAKKVVVLGCVSLVLWANYRSFGELSMFIRAEEINKTTRSTADYLPALRFLDEIDDEQKVVLTHPESRLSLLIPVYTKHYALFSNGGILHFASNDEIQERYLIAAHFTGVSPATIKDGLRTYGGVAAAFHDANTINRPVKLCRALRLDRLGYRCGDFVEAAALQAPTFEKMYARYIDDTQPNLRELLEKYHLRYIIKDLEQDADFNLELLDNVENIYSDERFEIYQII